MDVQRIADGLWRWTLAHPGWPAAHTWPRDMASSYAETAEATLLVDPLAPAHGTDDARRFWQALDRDVGRVGLPVVVLLTRPAHRRSAAAMRERYPGCSVWAAAAHVADLGDVVTDRFDDGDELPGGTRALVLADEAAFELRQYRTLALGDVAAVSGPAGLRRWRGRLDDVARLAALDVDCVLPGHGPALLEDASAALAAALQLPPLSP